jgi:hypothetical protein
MKYVVFGSSLLVLFFSFSTFAAEPAGQPAPSGQPTVGLSQNAPSPLLAGGLSLIAPGTGQMYNNETIVGGLMLATEIGLYVTAFAYAGAFSPGEKFSFRDRESAYVLLTMAIALHAYSVFDAVTEANRVSRNLDKFSFNINPFSGGSATVAYRWNW